MLRIGEFSRLSQVTVKTLRYYDEIGLLTPAHVDPLTNHRSYQAEQLPRIHRIVALKELGLSLEQIALMLDDSPDVEKMRGMLHLKRAEIQHRVRDEQHRLAQVEFRLRMLEAEEYMPDIEIIVKPVAAFRALTLRRRYATPAELQRAGEEMQAMVVAAGVTSTGVPLEIHHGEEFTLVDLDVEFAGPVGTTWTQDVPMGMYGALSVRDVAALASAATYMHEGSLEHLPEKLALVQRWAVANNYRIGDEVRLVYHGGPLHYQHEANVVEVQCKVAPVETPAEVEA